MTVGTDDVTIPESFNALKRLCAISSNYIRCASSVITEGKLWGDRDSFSNSSGLDSQEGSLGSALAGTGLEEHDHFHWPAPSGCTRTNSHNAGLGARPPCSLVRLSSLESHTHILSPPMDQLSMRRHGSNPAIPRKIRRACSN